MSDETKNHADDDETADSGLHAQDGQDDTEGHMHPEEFPQGPIRRNDDGVQGNLPQS